MLASYWNPWSIFDELDRAMHSTAGSSEWPKFEVEDSEDETILTADVPGMTVDDLEVTVAGQVLTIHGERKVKHGRHAGRSYTFERRFSVGDTYDLDDIRAHVQDGVLTLALPKAARAKPRRIKLTSGVVEKVKGFLTGGKDKEKREAA
jgi:HSP20 family protein